MRVLRGNITLSIYTASYDVSFKSGLTNQRATFRIQCYFDLMSTFHLFLGPAGCVPGGFHTEVTYEYIFFVFTMTGAL